MDLAPPRRMDLGPPVALINFHGAHEVVDSRHFRPKTAMLISASDDDQRGLASAIVFGRVVRPRGGR
jgi:hypothetical protein